MQIVVALVFLGVWLLILWAGSVALEASGMERRKARFQALSALTGTGFTTTEAESVVNHPRRRHIVTWLIVLGNVGIVAFLLLVILYIRSGLIAPSPLFIGMVALAIVLVVLCVRLGLLDRINDAILGALRRGGPGTAAVTEEVLHQAGGYGVVRLSVRPDRAEAILGDIGLKERGLAVIAIERGDTVLPFPGAEEPLRAGDWLLCYGDIGEATR